jgi:hypothetical protein
VSRLAGWLELAVGTYLVGWATLPFTRFCSGRVWGLDCESRAIVGVNLVGPLGLLLLVCATWMLWTASPRSQYALALGVVALAACTLLQLVGP